MPYWLAAIIVNHRTDLLGEDTAKSCTGLIAELTKLSAFRGSGGEMIRVAVLTMIENIARSGITFSQEDVQQLQAQVDINLVYEEGNVQDAAVSTFKALCEAFYSDPKATSWGTSLRLAEPPPTHTLRPPWKATT